MNLREREIFVRRLLFNINRSGEFPGHVYRMANGVYMVRVNNHPYVILKTSHEQWLLINRFGAIVRREKTLKACKAYLSVK